MITQLTEDLARMSSRVRPREVTRECGTQTRASEEREDVQTVDIVDINN